MPRTRDYFLMICTVAFLVVAIFATSTESFGEVKGTPALVYSSIVSDSTYTATVPEHGPTRADRIKELRDKISKQKDIFVAAAIPREEVVEQVEVKEEEVKVENRCASYREFTLPWNASGIQIVEVEGARLVYRNVPIPASDSMASGTALTVPIFTKQSLIQLPLPSLPNQQSQCLPTDVIGIANNGALIRNSEIGFYSEFGEQTLIGYALDGFPIYGTSDLASDSCGGLIVSGQYRYQLSNERTVMINCFSGTPVSL